MAAFRRIEDDNEARLDAVEFKVRLVVVSIAACLCQACGAGPGQGAVDREWTAKREARGDTLVVHTVAGSVWRDTVSLVPELTIGVLDGPQAYVFGRIAALEVHTDGRLIVLDRLAREVRVFSENGEHLLSFGREGGGPGEFRSPDHLRATADGHVVVRDQALARFAVFTALGKYVGGWPLGSGFSTNRPFYLDDAQRVLNPSTRDALVAYDLDGTPSDTIPVPSRGFEPARLEVSLEGGRSSYSIPFMPEEWWALTRTGEVLFGTSDRYRVERWNRDGSVLRIGRAVARVQVEPGERAQARERLTRTIRRSHDPSWDWSGPEVPKEKPWFQYLLAGVDGTIWVFRELHSVEEPDPDRNADRSHDGIATRWRAPLVADVFDEEGRFLGPVALPDGVNWNHPAPILAEDQVWAVRMHETGYPQVVRFRIVRD